MLTRVKSGHFRTLLLRATMVAACAALSCGVGLAAEEVSLTFQEKNGRYNIEGSFQVEADPHTAWSVLSDYDHIPQFVHNMKLSHIQIREGNDVLLHQVAEGGFLFFTQRVRLFLYIQETPDKTIAFKDMAHKDFKVYKGSWTITPDSGGGPLNITYQLEADLNFSAPDFIAGDVMSGGAKDLLKSVRKEILQRQAQVSPTPSLPVKLTQAPHTTPEAVSLR